MIYKIYIIYVGNDLYSLNKGIIIIFVKNVEFMMLEMIYNLNKEIILIFVIFVEELVIFFLYRIFKNYVFIG